MCAYMYALILCMIKIRKLLLLQDIVKWTTLVLAFTVLLCYGWFGTSHEREQDDVGLLISLLVSHDCIAIYTIIKNMG